MYLLFITLCLVTCWSGSTDNRVPSFAYYYDESDSNDKGIVVVVKTTNNDWCYLRCL